MNVILLKVINYWRILKSQIEAIRLLGNCNNRNGTFTCYCRFIIFNVCQLRDHELLRLVYECLNDVVFFFAF